MEVQSSNCPSHRPLPYQAPISLVREMLEPVSAVVMALFVTTSLDVGVCLALSDSLVNPRTHAMVMLPRW